MRFLSTVDISASGMTAQRLRMDVIANNLANVNTTRTPQGGPYRRQVVVFESRTPGNGGFRDLLNAYTGGEAGVRVKAIREDTSPFKRVYDAGNPDADQEGYVNLPNVNVVSEMVDMISATRAYEANVSVIEATKSMAMKALEIGR